MEKDINFEGINLSPYRDSSPDGQLTHADNLEQHAGSLRPSMLIGNNYTFDDGKTHDNLTLLYVHAISDGQMTFILSAYDEVSSTSYLWAALLNADNTLHLQPSDFCDIHGKIKQVVSVGNTLVISTEEEGIVYALFKAELNGTTLYRYLGATPPECKAAFYLKGLCRNFYDDKTKDEKKDDEWEPEFDGYSETHCNFTIPTVEKGWWAKTLIELGEDKINSTKISEEDISTFSNAIYAKINKFADGNKKRGRFMYPFFVRYAYRIYDGTYIMHSSPVLMIPNTLGKPIVGFSWGPYVDEKDTMKDFSFFVVSPCLGLYVQANGFNASTIAELYNWKDIIKSIDIFISEPLLGYKPDGKIEEIGTWSYIFSEIPSTYSQLINAKLYNEHYNTGITNDYPTQRQIIQFSAAFGTKYIFYLLGENTPELEQKKWNLFFKLPDPDEPLNEKIGNAATFYKFRSYELGEDPSEFEMNKDDNVWDEDENTLPNLPLKPTLPDDYFSHDKKAAKYILTYNHRLNMANIIRTPFEGYNVPLMQQYTKNNILVRPTNGIDTCMWEIKTYIYIRNNVSEPDVIVLNNGSIKAGCLPNYIFYPNPAAYKCVMKITTLHYNDATDTFTTMGSHNYKVDLKEHPFLNGAYWFSGFNANSMSLASSLPTPTADLVIKETNLLYTSNADNPFVFTPEGVTTVGVGNIIGMATVVRAVSQGQFGQYPMMVFCDDGNYALAVQGTGLFASVTPMQRDVCTNPNSITQIDGSIIFVSNRGVMNADGSNIECLFGALTGVPEDLPGPVNTLYTQYGGLPEKFPYDFFEGCHCGYDYANQRLLFFNSEGIYKGKGCYIFSINTKTWSTAQFGEVKTILNVFPYSYLQFVGNGTAANPSRIVRLNKIYDFAASDNKEGLLMTRPLKLDTQQLKRISQMELQGTFSATHGTDTQTIVLYGSQDGLKWHYLGRSNNRRIGAITGKYYKYFRIGIVANLSGDENITGMRIVYDVRPERRIR